MKHVPNWIGWIIALAVVALLTIVLFPLVGPAGAPAPQAPAVSAPVPPLATVNTPGGPLAITPVMVLIALVLFVVGGGVVTGVVLAAIMYKANEFVVMASQPYRPPKAARPRRTAAGHVAMVPYRIYIAVFVALVVLTALEVALASVPGSAHDMIIPILAIFALAKASLVAMFYMHLHYDNPIYTYIFATPLVFMVVLAFFVLQLQ